MRLKYDIGIFKESTKAKEPGTEKKILKVLNALQWNISKGKKDARKRAPNYFSSHS